MIQMANDAGSVPTARTFAYDSKKIYTLGKVLIQIHLRPSSKRDVAQNANLNLTFQLPMNLFTRVISDLENSQE